MSAAAKVSARFLDPATLDGLGDLALLARAVVEGFLAGRHLDLRPGAGVEFSQYRAYQPGDDLRRVDWRVYGRSDRLMVREAEVERDVTVRLVLDASRSMAYADPLARRRARPLSKLDYGRLLVACLGYLAERQGDSIAAHVVGGGARLDLEARRRGEDLERLCALLETAEPHGRWPPWSQLGPQLAGRQRRRQLVVLVSDLYEQGDEMSAALRALRAARHEVLVMHLVGRAELELGWHGDVVFEDLETGDTVRADTEALRPAYRARFAAHLDAWRRRILDLGAEHHLMVIDQPVDRAIESFVARRRALP